MNVKTVGEAGLTGWREPVASRGARVLSRRTSLRHDQARALIGLGFLALAVAYVGRAIVQLARSDRS
jgi:hypothetical protein